MKVLQICAVAIFLAGFSMAGQAANDPEWWLERMGTAMSQMSYQGTFIYISDGRMETMRITHVVDEHGTRERLSSLSGPQREVVRDESGVKWSSAEEGSVVADPVVSWPMFLDQSKRGLPGNSNYYQLKLRGRQRVAELSSQRVDIIANDSYRYGYSLWLETESGLLLKWQLTGQDGETLAKLEFTDLKIGSEVDRSELKYHKPGKEQVSSGLPVGAAKSLSESTPWQPGWLPDGFRVTANRAPSRQTDNRFQHLVYSDGIASVSLYVEPLENSAGVGLGLSRLGTSHVYGRKTDEVFVTVVGDVPAVTVEKIAQSVNFAKP